MAVIDRARVCRAESADEINGATEGHWFLRGARLRARIAVCLIEKIYFHLLFIVARLLIEKMPGRSVVTRSPNKRSQLE